MRLTFDEMIAKISEFNLLNATDFYQLNVQYFLEISDNETLAMNRILGDGDIEEGYEEEHRNEYMEFFKDKVNKKDKATKNTKYISEAHKITQEKQLAGRKWIAKGKDYFLMSLLLDEAKIRDTICSNPMYGRNIYTLINKRGTGKIRCIFKPSRRLLRTYDFIEPKYTRRNLIGYDIDTERLKDYGIIQILPDDILEIYWGAYDPYIRSLVQNKDYSGLRTDLKI